MVSPIPRGKLKKVNNFQPGTTVLPACRSSVLPYHPSLTPSHVNNPARNRKSRLNQPENQQQEEEKTAQVYL